MRLTLILITALLLITIAPHIPGLINPHIHIAYRVRLLRKRHPIGIPANFCRISFFHLVRRRNAPTLHIF